MRDLRVDRQRALEPPHVPDAGRREVHRRARTDDVQRGPVRISLEGDRFFYPNVLESIGQHQRAPGSAAPAARPTSRGSSRPCPASLTLREGPGRLRQSVSGRRCADRCGDNKLRLVQQTGIRGMAASRSKSSRKRPANSPSMSGSPVGHATNRCPAICIRSGRIIRRSLVDRQRPTVPLQIEKGYARLQRNWKPGDTSSWTADARTTNRLARNIATNRGKVALQRGPLVYCLEGPTTMAKCWTWSSRTMPS
jgi:uncharacterized protein